MQSKTKEVALLFSTFLIAISGLVYELLLGTVSSYFLGDSIYHFSLVIGLFMSAMGIGSWFSRFVERELVKAFVYLQMLIALMGGLSAVVLFYAFGVIDNYEPFLYLETILIGAMLGMEIPLIIRILKDYFPLKTNISNVFTMDYIGALMASLLFPMVLLPKLGLLQTGLFFGLFNALVALMGWYLFRQDLPRKILLYLLLTFGVLMVGFWRHSTYADFIQNRLYQDPVIYAETTPYQSMVITRKHDRIRLYINGALQFDAYDEYRYHESLVHPAMLASHRHDRVLIIGGGDGLVLREVLKYDDVQRVTLVDLDKKITTLFATAPLLRELNHNAFHDPRVTVKNEDAWKFIEHAKDLYNVIIVDLPDPNSVALGRLYSKKFYTMLGDHLAGDGAMTVQSTAPLYARKAFYCIVKTIESSGLKTLPYHTYVPSFGEWGFTLAMHHTIHFDTAKLPRGLRYLAPQELTMMQHFPPDMQPLSVEVNTLFNHKLIHYYEEGWSHWYE